MTRKPTDPRAHHRKAHYGDPMARTTGQHRVTTAPQVDLFLETHGATAVDDPSGSRTPVLLLHGLSQQGRFWGPVITRLRSRPVATLDQRGHGGSDTAADQDFGVPACARDVLAVLDHLGWARAVVVGHSWGAWIALAAAALTPDRVAAAVLIDGGLSTPGGVGPREAVRTRLTPPALGIPEAELWDLISRGQLGRWWSPEVRQALEPTFAVDEAGLARTRLGMERHLKVLDGLLDHDPGADLDACESAGVPVWAAVCEARPGAVAPDEDEATRMARLLASAAAAARRSNTVVHRWPGAVHDVPLQWPALVAGFIDTVVEDREGA